jgi:hypothetical protein
MPLVLISENCETYPAELAEDMAVRGIPVAFNASGKLVPFCADGDGGKTSDCVGFLDFAGLAGQTRSVICGGMMGDDGNTYSPVTGTPGHPVFGGITAGTITASAPNASTDLVVVLGRWWSPPGMAASTTDKFVIDIMPAMLASGQPS